MYSRQQERDAACFLIRTQDKEVVEIERVDLNRLYNNNNERGFVRKAILKNLQGFVKDQRFVDREFSVVPTGSTRVVRLFDLIKTTKFLFPSNQISSSYIQPDQHYNSFVAESGIISYDYARTLFITQVVNPEGYYQYFVKRNGEYYVEQCDDTILVDKNTLKPIWGLDINHPWQILLFKAWLKECRSVDNLVHQQAFSFLQAFGLPEYRLFNFRKQLKFLIEEKVPETDKKQKLNYFTMYDKEIIIIARTVDSTAVRKVGLVPNKAAYRLQLEDETNKSKLFRLYSSLPCYWVGSHSPVYQTSLNQILRSQMNLDLQRNFLMNQKEAVTYFNKCYAAPTIASKPKNLLIQDCMNVKSQIGVPIWINIRVLDTGMLAMCIEVPKQRTGPKNSYPQFRYFLSKKIVDQQEMSRSHFREDIANSRLEQNMYVSSDCDKWRYYRIDYVQGYENHAGFFTKVEKGQYVLFIQAEYNGNLRVRFDSHVKMEEPYQYQPSPSDVKQIFDSTFFTISAVSAVEATFNQALFEQSIALNNSFEELGFGSICIKTLAKAKHKVAMRVYPEKLREHGLQLLSHYNLLQQEGGKEKNFIFVSEKGKPKIVVLERINNRSKSEIGEIFPPPGSVEFFKVMPNRVFNPQGQNVLLPTR